MLNARLTKRQKVHHEPPRRERQAERVRDLPGERDELALLALDVDPVRELDDRLAERPADRARERVCARPGREDVPREDARGRELRGVVPRRDARVRVRVHELALLAPRVAVRERGDRPVEAHPARAQRAHPRERARGTHRSAIGVDGRSE
jgi:hypothetical protein